MKMIMMKQLNVSESARKHFKNIIDKKQCFGLVFRVKQAGCSGLKYDMDFVEVAPKDAHRLPYDEVNLFVDDQSQVYLAETSVGLEVASLGQTKVVFYNPQAQNACGCGESFNLKGGQ